jgi:hypothetical protein
MSWPLLVFCKLISYFLTSFLHAREPSDASRTTVGTRPAFWRQPLPSPFCLLHLLPLIPQHPPSHRPQWIPLRCSHSPPSPSTLPLPSPFRSPSPLPLIEGSAACSLCICWPCTMCSIDALFFGALFDYKKPLKRNLSPRVASITIAQ